MLQMTDTQPWAGAIHFTTYQQKQQWLESYWQVIKPYAMIHQEVA